MTYKNMFEITKYCKNNGVELDTELIDILVIIDSISEKLFPLLKLESGLAKKLLKCYVDYEERLSPLFGDADIDLEEIIYCLKLIASVDTWKKKLQMCIACEIDAIREDKEALELIASGDTWEKMKEIRLACLHDSIREDKVALNLIAGGDTWKQVNQMRLACLNDAIREDKVALRLIASGDTWVEMELLRKTCENDAIRTDKEALNLIANQYTWQRMAELRIACENDAIRKDKVALKIIASGDTWDHMQDIRLVCEHATIRENKDLLHLIASRKTWEEMRQICQTYLDKLSPVKQKETDIKPSDAITEERARLEQERKLLNLLRTGKIEEFQDLFQENPDLNGETVVKR